MASLLDTARRQLTAALREAEREVQRLRAALEALGGAGRRQSAKPSAPTHSSKSRKPVAGSVATRTAASRHRAKPSTSASAGRRRQQPAKRSAPTRGAGGKDTRQAVLDAVTSNPGTNATKLTALTGLSMGTVRSRLGQLSDEGLIRREGAGAKTSWHRNA